MNRVSVLTPTHNRADKLGRLYESLCRSTYKDFVWIIVDDGSTDDTKEVVLALQTESPFPIQYVYQVNGGKHTALERLYTMAESEYCFQIDDDDELLPDAMETGLQIWDSMDPKQRELCWCVCGRCRDAATEKMVGAPFPAGINEMDEAHKRRALAGCGGEKCGFQKVSAVQQFHFPNLEGCKFIPESILWKQIDKVYNQFYVNEVFRIYHQFEGVCLSNREKSAERYQNDYRIYKFLLMDGNLRPQYLSRSYLTYLYHLKTSADHAQIGKQELVRGLTWVDRVSLVVFALPIRYLRKRRGE